jgi:hypothetical protein
MRNDYIGPKKRARLKAMQEEYRDKIKLLREHGYEIVIVNYHGKNPMTWSFSYNGKRSAYGWDHESQVVHHLLANLGEQPK